MPSHQTIAYITATIIFFWSTEIAMTTSTRDAGKTADNVHSSSPKPARTHDSAYSNQGRRIRHASFSRGEKDDSHTLIETAPALPLIETKPLPATDNIRELQQQPLRQRYGEYCECWNSSDGVFLEVECSCTHLVPNTTLAKNVHRIIVEGSKTFTTLSNDLIRPFAKSLLEITLSELPEFSHIEDNAFTGMANLQTIYVLGTPALKNISHGVFKGYFPKLKTIRISHTGLQVTPMFNQLFTGSHLDSLDLENNKISRIEPNWIAQLEVDHLTLSYNNLEYIGAGAFSNSRISKLTLEGNRHLKELHPEAFVGIIDLRELDLSKTSITALPTRGLRKLEILRVQQTSSLTVIPSIYHFQHLTEAELTYPYHCCAFYNPETHDPVEYKNIQDSFEKMRQEHCGPKSSTASPENIAYGSEVDSLETLGSRKKREPTPTTQSHLQEFTRFQNPSRPGLTHPESTIIPSTFDPILAERPNSQYFAFDPSRSFPPDLEAAPGTRADEKTTSLEVNSGEPGGGHFGDNSWHPPVTVGPSKNLYGCGQNVTVMMVSRLVKVKCSPEPDAFSPCEDIMGNMWLRVAVWIVVTLALVGNAAVLVVLILTPGRMSVQRFLMANLSFADLSMGIYLMMVAIQDLVSLGTYFNFAIEWQLGWGCQLAGFLTVFASELSVFTLAIITGERWYALTRAIHLTKRLTIKGAAKFMILGWILAINLASLPLFGISSYSKTSICLPMEANTTLAQVYLAFMLVFNGLAFTMVAYAYWQMYRTVAGHSGGAPAAAQSADLAIAKKMGLLVFTDFVCWAPVAFFGLTAVAGHPLIGVTDAKILLVFFYPLNSFCNPYLYAIMTKQYRRDLFHLLHRHGICTQAVGRMRAAGGVGASTNNTVPTMMTIMRLNSVTDNPANRSSNAGLGTRLDLNIKSPSKFPFWKNRSNGRRSLRNSRSGPGENHSRPNDTSTSQGGITGENKDVGSETFRLASVLSHSDSQEEAMNDRMRAETSFVSIPISYVGGAIPADSSVMSDNKSPVSPVKDSSDDAEVSENTPFCSNIH